MEEIIFKTLSDRPDLLTFMEKLLDEQREKLVSCVMPFLVIYDSEKP